MDDAAPVPLMLSVSGARGIVGESMTPDVARQFAAAFASILAEQSPSKTPRIVIGRDGRPSGESLTRAAIEGISSAGCHVIDLGIAMTPTVGVMIRHHRAAGGMVITASHNPIQWNGLKCLNRDGVTPPVEFANQIIARFKSSPVAPASLAAPASAGAAHPSITRDHSANGIHLKKVLAAIDPDPIRQAGFTVVLDSINGAGGAPGRALLNEYGCEVIHLNDQPTGAFKHPPEPIPENLVGLTEVVVGEGAAVGFAQDPDGDRLAIVDETGRSIGEEYTLALCAQCVLERSLGATGDDQRESPVPEPRAGRKDTADGVASAVTPAQEQVFLITNLSTSRMIDDIAAPYPNVEIMRTPVGEAHVVAAMKAHGERAILGGEGNGGVIFPPVCLVRDSLSSMALVLDLMANRAALERDPSDPPQTLSRIVESLPRYHMIKRKFDLSDLGGRAAVDSILDRVKRAFANEKINDSDGVRIDFDNGWVHLRPSNTEPIVRLIAEAETKRRAESLAEGVTRAVSLQT